MRPKTILLSLASLVAVAVLTTGFGTWRTHRTEQIAQAFKSDFAGVRPGTDSQKTEDLFNTYATFGHRSGVCTKQNCEYGFGFDNRWLWRLRLSQPKALVVHISIKNGSVDFTRLLFKSGLNASLMVDDVNCYPCAPAPQPFGVSLGFPWHSKVILTPASTPAQRRAAQQLNLKLLLSTKNVKDGGELYPAYHEFERQLLADKK